MNHKKTAKMPKSTDNGEATGIEASQILERIKITLKPVMADLYPDKGELDDYLEDVARAMRPKIEIGILKRNAKKP